MNASHFVHVLRRSALGLLLSAGCLGSAQAAVVNLTASQSTVQLGGNVSLFLNISGLTPAALGGFDLDLSFNNAVFAFAGFSFDDGSTGLNQLDLAEPGKQAFAGGATDIGGGIDAFAVSGNSTAKLDADQADAFRFLTLNFTAIGLSAGTDLSVDLNDINLSFFDAEANPLNFSFATSTASVVVNAANGGGSVPEPATLPLAAAALLGLLGARGAGGSRRWSASAN
jgi:hypothetical protein